MNRSVNFVHSGVSNCHIVAQALSHRGFKTWDKPKFSKKHDKLSLSDISLEVFLSQIVFENQCLSQIVFENKWTTSNTLYWLVLVLTILQ